MSDSTAFEDWLEALPYDERATLCFKKVWDAAQACKDDPQQRTYCLKHYRRTFPEKGCDMCEMEARIEALEKAAQRRVDCGHDDECGGRTRDRCGCGHTDLENALEMLLP